jgi:hypothetical protein
VGEPPKHQTGVAFVFGANGGQAGMPGGGTLPPHLKQQKERQLEARHLYETYKVPACLPACLPAFVPACLPA